MVISRSWNQFASLMSVFSLCLSVGERAGAAEGAEEAGGKRQVASGVCAARQRFPPVAAGDQVEDSVLPAEALETWGFTVCQLCFHTV